MEERRTNDSSLARAKSRQTAAWSDSPPTIGVAGADAEAIARAATRTADLGEPAPLAMPRDDAPTLGPSQSSDRPSPPGDAGPEINMAASEDRGDELRLITQDDPQEDCWAKVFDATAAFGASTAVHLALVVILGLISLPMLVQSMTSDLVATANQPTAELLHQTLDERIDPARRITLDDATFGSLAAAQSLASVLPPPVIDRRAVQANEVMPSLDIGSLEVFASNSSRIAESVPEGTLGEPQAVVTGYSDAMDRITREILLLLAKDKVLVIWCFDQSESMLDDRQEILSRIDRVYQELGLAEAAAGDALLTAITSYGQEWAVHTEKPTSDAAAVRKAIAAVPVDRSGMEMMCMAVSQSIATYRKYATQGHRQLALIMVTDESGDQATNVSLLESTIASAKSTRCPVYVLGREAVFGFPYARMRWVDPKTKLTFWLRIDRGPETPFPEQLQTEGFHQRYDSHPSGFGPYEQVRLARETGGVFFMLPSPETNLVRSDNRKYSLDSMRPYLPELAARGDYARERDTSEFRRVVWKVILELNPYDEDRRDDITVRDENLPIEPSAFAAVAVEEIKKAEKLVEYFRQARQALEKARPLRAREESLRWRANYDLIYAQTLAYEALLREYALGMAEFAKKPPAISNPRGKKEATNAWDVRPQRALRGGDKSQSLLNEAKRLLREVASEHAGTPYAARAEYELRRGYGVRLVEDYVDPRRRAVKTPNL